ncbi:MAG: hydrogenase maturation protease [Methanocellales archaeon]
MKIKVLGCGNILSSDEGVGIHIIRRLRDLKLPRNVEIVDAGEGGIAILDLIKDAKKVIIADAITTVDGEVGEVYRFDDRDLLNRDTSTISFHNLNLGDIIKVGEIIQPEAMPEEIVVFGIEVESDETFGTELSPRVRASVPIVVEMILAEIKRMNEELEQRLR